MALRASVIIEDGVKPTKIDITYSYLSLTHAKKKFEISDFTLISRKKKGGGMVKLAFYLI